MANWFFTATDESEDDFYDRIATTLVPKDTWHPDWSAALAEACKREITLREVIAQFARLRDEQQVVLADTMYMHTTQDDHFFADEYSRYCEAEIGRWEKMIEQDQMHYADRKPTREVIALMRCHANELELNYLVEEMADGHSDGIIGARAYRIIAARIEQGETWPKKAR